MEIMEIKTSVSIDKFNNAQLRKYSTVLVKSVNGLKKNTFDIAKALWQIKTSECYKDDFDSFSSFCEKAVGMPKSRASRLVNVYERFQSNTNLLSDYSVAQITELLPLDNEEMSDIITSGNVTAEMPSPEIRKAVKAYRNSEEATEETTDETTEETAEETTEETTEEIQNIDDKIYEWLDKCPIVLDEELTKKIYELIR